MQSETARVEAFSDGVFAIAIRLLILEIKIPKPDQGIWPRRLLCCCVVQRARQRCSEHFSRTILCLALSLMKENSAHP
jgi:hypothetical protein